MPACTSYACKVTSSRNEGWKPYTFAISFLFTRFPIRNDTLKWYSIIPFLKKKKKQKNAVTRALIDFYSDSVLSQFKRSILLPRNYSNGTARKKKWLLMHITWGFWNRSSWTAVWVFKKKCYMCLKLWKTWKFYPSCLVWLLFSFGILCEMFQQ